MNTNTNEIAKIERLIGLYSAKVASGHERASYYAKMVEGSQRRLAVLKAGA